jgi:hypothetical protein
MGEMLEIAAGIITIICGVGFAALCLVRMGWLMSEGATVKEAWKKLWG